MFAQLRNPFILGILVLPQLMLSQKMDYTQEEKQFRPHFHFSPKNNWINDPNGMFYWEGTYHLYFQYHPFSNIWGPMHWGHATSEDLIHWKEQPIALFPDKLGTIFSGSAVVDHQNTSGFGSIENPPIVAIYTNHDHDGEDRGNRTYETQSIAYSLDKGYSWMKYDGNPVIANPGNKDFRDPKVFWDNKNQKWVMALAVKDVVYFYGSSNLKQWEKLSTFGKDMGNHSGVWECPELMELPIAGSPNKKWVLLVSINPGGPNGGSATQYFIGDWDGSTFTVDPNFAQQISQKQGFWLDFGKDNYASVSFDNLEHPDGKRVIIGWMSNWEYAREVPTQQWKNQMTIAREIDLVPFGKTFRLRVKPEPSIYKNTKLKKKWNQTTFDTKTVLIAENGTNLSNILLKSTLTPKENERYTFQLESPEGDLLTFGYDSTSRSFFLDRTGLQINSFSDDFAAQIQKATRTALTSNIPIEVIIDKTSVELFFDDGETALTALYFAKAPFNKLSLSSTTDKINLDDLTIFEIATPNEQK